MPVTKRRDYDIYSALPALMASESPIPIQSPSISTAVSDLFRAITPEPSGNAPTYGFGIEAALPELMATQTPIKAKKPEQPLIEDFLKDTLPPQTLPQQMPQQPVQSLIDVNKLRKLFSDPRATPAFYKLALGILSKVLQDYMNQQAVLVTEKTKGTGRLLDIYKTLTEKENNLMSLMAQPTFHALPDVTKNQIIYELANTRGTRQALLNQMLQGIPVAQGQTSSNVNPENVRKILEIMSR